MLRFGGTLTLNGLVVYVAYNLEKVLLGRFWGAEATGLYGRAYQLITIPTDNLNSSVGEVAFAALSRVQNDPTRFRSYFLKGYSLVLALTIPITVVCAVLSDELILVLLGPRWSPAAQIFRLLAPTILIFAMINPLGWLLVALGLVDRSLRVALVLAPIVVGGYVAGLRFGPSGVALGYSVAMTLWVIPHIAWCVHGTAVTLRDVLAAVSRPLFAGLAAGLLALGVNWFCVPFWAPLPRLLVASLTLAGVYVFVLLYVMKQKDFYLDVVRGFRKRSVPTEVFVS